ncbi:MAG TPA: hypothetical protein VKY22_15940 [Bradyrhizobium sp.]|nr:hypothetical protein [Bradyrhizobium sp.]
MLAFDTWMREARWQNKHETAKSQDTIIELDKSEICERAFGAKSWQYRLAQSPQVRC